MNTLHKYDNKDSEKAQAHRKRKPILDIQIEDDDGELKTILLDRTKDGLVLTTSEDGEQQTVQINGPVGKAVRAALEEMDLDDFLDKGDMKQIVQAVRKGRGHMPHIEVRASKADADDAAMVKIVVDEQMHGRKMHKMHKGHSEHPGMKGHHRDNDSVIGDFIPIVFFAMIGTVLFFYIKSRRDVRLELAKSAPETLKDMEKSGKSPSSFNTLRRGYTLTGVGAGIIFAWAMVSWGGAPHVIYLVGALLGAGVALLLYSRHNQGSNGDQGNNGEQSKSSDQDGTGSA